MPDDQDNLILCNDAQKLDRPVCWPEDPAIAQAAVELLGECGIDCRTEDEHGTTKVFVAAADHVAACAAFQGMMYGRETRDDEVRQLRDLIQRLYDHAPPSKWCYPRSAEPYAAAMREAVDLLRRNAATKGGA